MKFLKIMLGIFLLVILSSLGAVIFSDKILMNITKTKYSEFENVDFLINKSEMTFDNFLLNGNKLGKGRAKLNVKKTGIFNLVPQISITELKLEDVDLNNVYNLPNGQIDSLMEKIDAPIENVKIEKTTENYLNEVTKKCRNIK